MTANFPDAADYTTDQPHCIATESSSKLDATLDLHERGLSLLRISPHTKKPIGRWKYLQERRASRAKIVEWFGGDSTANVGTLYGSISGGAWARDFDVPESYHRWKEEHPDLARIMPTVATGRVGGGFHVYGRATAAMQAALRRSIGKSGRIGAIKLTDGELRIGVGCYCVVPPSIHSTGRVYDWIVPLPDGDLPLVDPREGRLFQRDMLPEKHRAERKPQRADQSENGAHVIGEVDYWALPAGSTMPRAVFCAIESTLPKRRHGRNDAVFDFARELLAIPEYRCARAAALLPYLEEWHRRALPRMETTDFNVTRSDFIRAWDTIEYPAGTEPIMQSLEVARAADPPRCAMQFKKPAKRLLASLCRELQRQASDAPFFLSGRKAGELVVGSESTARRWLQEFVAAGILSPGEKGTYDTMLASEFKYIGDSYAEAA